MTGPRVGSVLSKLVNLRPNDSVFFECDERGVARMMMNINTTAYRAGIAITQEHYIAVCVKTTQAVNLVKVSIK